MTQSQTRSPQTERGAAPLFRRLLYPSLFFAAVIYYEEIFLKLYCFHALSLPGAAFTLLFSLPPAALLGLLCGGVSPKRGRLLLPLCTGIISLWLGAQAIYYHLFKAFMTIFSLTKMVMVAQSFGNTVASEILLNWFAVVMMALPVTASLLLRRRLIPDQPPRARGRLQWAGLAALLQLAAMGLVLLCNGGSLSLRYIYTQSAAPELAVRNFGMLTETQLEVVRVAFGVEPDDPSQRDLPKWRKPLPDDAEQVFSPSGGQPSPDVYNVMEIDFDALIAQETDETLLKAHQWFSQREPSARNEWTGRFQGKNLIWIVAEGFSTLAMDPQRTPTLWKLSHEGIICENFYTPLWGVSTSDGEYVTTTGLIPKAGVWSYSQSAENYMPFGFGSQFKKLGYRAIAFHDYLYNYYDRNLSHPNMGYEYYAVGQGLELTSATRFPPSDLEMMEKIVPMFVDEEQFMVYCLTVSGHLRYNLEENVMSLRHYDEVADLPYSEAVKCYLACQMELELAMESLVSQLEAAGRLEDTVIVLSADHYPYGLTDEEYSELLGHPVDPVFEIYENTLILWSADLEEPVHVDKYCSSLDVMPTLANLFGLEYDSRLVMGSDILSDSDELVVFANYSFINGTGFYNSITDQFTSWDGGETDTQLVAQMVAEVQNRVAFSSVILDYDYYRLALNGPPKEEESLLPFLGGTDP